MKIHLAVRFGAAAAALLVASLGTIAQAQGPGGPGWGGGFGPHRPPMEQRLGPNGHRGEWWNDPVMVDKLKLTDAQRKQMDSTLEQHKLQLVDLHAALDKEELTLEPLMKADQPDEARILDAIDHIAKARAELEKANARFLLGIRRQLTPEQWKQLEAARMSRGAGHRPGMDNGHGGMWRKPGPEGPNAPAPGPQGMLHRAPDDLAGGDPGAEAEAGGLAELPPPPAQPVQPNE